MPGIAVVIVAAGKGERAGGAVPKQYVPLLGKPMLRWTAEAFVRHPDVDLVQIVIGANDEMPYGEAMRGLSGLAAAGGRTDAAAFGDAWVWKRSRITNLTTS